MNPDSRVYNPETETQESHKETPHEIDFRDFNIEEEKPIPLESLAHLLRENKESLSEGVKRKFYWGIKNAMYGKPITFPEGDDWFVTNKKDPRNNSPYQATAVLFLGPKYENISRAQRDARKTQPRLEFQFSGSEEHAKTEQEDSYYFHSLDSFKLNGIYLRPKSPEPGTWDTSPALNVEDYSHKEITNIKNTYADFTHTKSLLTELQKPERTFTEAEKTFTDLVKKQGLPETEAGKFLIALREFGNYMYPKDPQHGDTSLVGECLVVPGQFAKFCRKKFHIDLDTPHYGFNTGNGQWSGYASYNEFHEVNVYGKKIVIDWTASQFKKYKDAPFPYIYEVGDNQKFDGTLYKETGETNNDPY